MVDYSRWNRIEISDDEDDTHPNIDTGSLFRWRHQARLERMEKHRQTRIDIECRLQEIEKKLAQFNPNDDVKKKEEILMAKHKLNQELAEWNRMDRLQPWNVDTISHDSWSKTIINRKAIESNDNDIDDAHDVDDDMNEINDAQMDQYAKHVEQYEIVMRDFAFHSRFDDSRRILLDNPNIVSQHSLDYLSLWCIQLKVEERSALLEHIARQTVLIQLILDLAKTVRGTDPRDCLPTFFSKAQENWLKFEQLWQQEIQDFHKRIQTAAEMRIERAIKEQSEKPETEKLIGPGGLDVQEVFDSLPEPLQECFIKRDIQMLKETLENMNDDEAEYHMKRCVDAGLWLTERPEDEDEQRLQRQLQLEQNNIGNHSNSDDLE
ncbi:hsp90 co-chaperone Cdc37-like protein [Euroglyphus maynei]|uniref:Hsp90 chaperone protein kinase-targeting subunit n=1 Tax=Euroglyphus maynei TaxID=6958 RepID=A0A1Y3B9Z7_EURMA|nr:hsp90 co-chaperone Cdc37-like protein [Euroglyphus maynei]